jgi:hypothetical protein
MKAAAKRRAPQLTGAQIQRTAFDMAANMGVHVAHFRPALTRDGKWRTAVAADGKGWPDGFFVGPAGYFWREIKRQTGDPVTDEQTAWLDWLTAAGADAGVWKEEDLRSGRIERELRAISKQPEGIRP